jgi:hypothetical protein
MSGHSPNGTLMGGVAGTSGVHDAGRPALDNMERSVGNGREFFIDSDVVSFSSRAMTALRAGFESVPLRETLQATEPEIVSQARKANRGLRQPPPILSESRLGAAIISPAFDHTATAVSPRALQDVPLTRLATPAPEQSRPAPRHAPDESKQRTPRLPPPEVTPAQASAAAAAERSSEMAASNTRNKRENIAKRVIQKLEDGKENREIRRALQAYKSREDRLNRALNIVEHMMSSVYRLANAAETTVLSVTNLAKAAARSATKLIPTNPRLRMPEPPARTKEESEQPLLVENVVTDIPELSEFTLAEALEEAESLSSQASEMLENFHEWKDNVLHSDLDVSLGNEMETSGEKIPLPPVGFERATDEELPLPPVGFERTTNEELPLPPVGFERTTNEELPPPPVRFDSTIDEEIPLPSVGFEWVPDAPQMGLAGATFAASGVLPNLNYGDDPEEDAEHPYTDISYRPSTI